MSVGDKMKTITKKIIWELLGFVGTIFAFAFGYSLREINVLTWIWLSISLFGMSRIFWFEKIFKISYIMIK